MVSRGKPAVLLDLVQMKGGEGPAQIFWHHFIRCQTGMFISFYISIGMSYFDAVKMYILNHSNIAGYTIWLQGILNAVKMKIKYWLHRSWLKIKYKYGIHSALSSALVAFSEPEFFKMGTGLILPSSTFPRMPGFCRSWHVRVSALLSLTSFWEVWSSCGRSRQGCRPWQLRRWWRSEAR